MQNYSVVIPTLQASKTLGSCLKHIRIARKNIEVIVADCGSTDNTINIARAHGANVITVEQGRGIQMNRGAQQANGEIFLFLHADTNIAPETFQALDDYFSVQHHQIGTFKMRFDINHWLLKFYGRMTHIDSIWTSFGDQGIAVRKSFFEAIGRFPDWPLFEDVNFLQRARQQVKIGSLDAEVVTSAGRFLQNGLVSQQVKNGWLLLKYLRGVSPERLSYEYNR